MSATRNPFYQLPGGADLPGDVRVSDTADASKTAAGGWAASPAAVAAAESIARPDYTNYTKLGAKGTFTIDTPDVYKRQAWDSLVSWFNGLWDNLFGNRSVNVDVNSSGTDGSHAGGLDYVPYNNYVANLHRGEMVLTADEATAYRKGEANMAGGMTINIDINGIQFSDVNSMAHALANQISYELQAQSNRKAAVYA